MFGMSEYATSNRSDLFFYLAVGFKEKQCCKLMDSFDDVSGVDPQPYEISTNIVAISESDPLVASIYSLEV